MKIIRLIFVWLLVGIPLAWGVSRSVQRSLPLFGIKPAEVQVAPAKSDSIDPVATPKPNSKS